MVDRDDGPRPGVTLEAVAGLKPVFRPDGTVTAGNCCPLNDGAAAVVVMSDRKARELGITPLARIVSTGVSALSPEIMGLGPVEASRRALRLAGMTIDDIDLVEINEAFAAQVIPSYRELGIDIDRLNVHGGAIALGHPFGMTGARITTTLLNGLVASDKTSAWRPCASAAARAWRWSSNGSAERVFDTAERMTVANVTVDFSDTTVLSHQAARSVRRPMLLVRASQGPVRRGLRGRECLQPRCTARSRPGRLILTGPVGRVGNLSRQRPIWAD